MYQEQRIGLQYSAILHGIFLLLMVFGLPSFLSQDRPLPPMVVSVDILPISELTNVKSSTAPLSEKEADKPVKEEKVPTPPAKKEVAPPVPIPKEKAEAKEKPVEKTPEKKEQKKPKKATQEDLDAVLKSLRDAAERDKKKEQAEKKKETTEDAGTRAKSSVDNYDDRIPMAMSELDAIRSQIAKCWNVPAGAKDAHELRVNVRVQLARDGTVLQVDLASDSKSRYSRDSFFRAAADSAIRAVRKCSPLKNLPADKYQTWRDMEMTFDPKEMLY